MKREMTFDEIIQKNHYKSIIALTNHYMKKYKNKFTGLRAAHYRYALCPNHDDIHNSVFKLEEYFGYDLQKLYDEGTVVKDCISDRKNLSNFLNKLVERGILLPVKRNRVTYYYTSPLIIGYVNKLSVLKMLESYDPATVENIYGLQIKDPENIMVSGAWFGSPLKIDFIPNDEEKKIITENFNRMYIAAAEIFNMFKKQKKDVADMVFVIDAGTPKKRKKE